MRHIVFDWSGTLADDLPPVLDATNRLLRHHGREAMSREDFRHRFRLPFRGFYEEVLPEIPLEQLEVLFGEFFSDSRKPVTLLPHAEAFLRFAAARGTRMFILSSARPEFLARQASQLGVAGFFEEIRAGVADKREELPRLLADHSLAASETAFIGDMEHDVETALSCGVHAVAVLTGYDPPHKLMRAAPEITVSHLGQLRRLMELTTPAAGGAASPGGDSLEIRGLKVSTRIGAGEEERARPQDLLVDVTFLPADGLHDLGDDLARTADYHALADAVTALAARGERRLIETLAEEIADLACREHGARWCQTRIRKFILPQTEWVGVTIEKGRR